MSVVHVAVGVVVDADYNILISHRAKHLHQGGLWEFPGGKVELGETVQAALLRELKEELAITVESCSPLIKIEHDYGDKKVLLDVWLVDRLQGRAQGVEGQAVKWISVSELDDYDFPAANHAIVEKVKAYIAEKV